MTRKLKTEILKVYNAYWDGYLKGDVKSMASLLADEYTQVGSAETEVFDTKRGAVRFLRDTIDQVAYKLEMRNRSTRIDPQGSLVLVHELCDVYVLADGEWMFYAKFRASTVMQKKMGEWKIIHQHSSFPDARTGEGVNIAIDKITAENQQLHEAVRRRTVELEQKSRELEIETALERVRGIAMGMKEPADMLGVCKAISLQLQSLGAKEIRNVQTAIFYEGRGTYMNYEYYARHKKTIITETSYTNHKVHKAFATKMLKGKGEIFVTHIKGKKVKDWIAYQKTTNVFIDRFLEKASSLNYYWHSLGPVALGMSTYAPLSKEELSVFKRFLNVFELAYTRYLDIEEARARTREAQIEASLEKVRAQAMGMRKPEDLPDVCEVLFKELQALGFRELRNAMVNIHNDDKRTFLNYDYSDEIGKSITPLFYNIHPVIEKQIKQIRSARDAFSETVFTGRDLAEWKEFRRRSGEKDDPRINTIAALYYYFYSIETGSIGISTFSSIGEEKLKVLKRFRNVFDFAYKRYMDVAQAEAQAYEARIEAALERVRTAAMSMRTSDDLRQVGETIFSELKRLGFSDIRNTEILINNDSRESILSHYYSDYGVSGTIEVFYNDHPVVKRWANDMKKASDAFVEVVVSEKEIGAWRKYREEIGYLPDPKLNAAKSVWYYSYSTGLGALSVSSFSPVTEERLRILERFRNVFGLAYRRYADVALAEAHARESQIELALERVRARSMAMHRSDELVEASDVVFQQLQSLGIESIRTGVATFDDRKETITVWSRAGTQSEKKILGVVPKNSHPFFAASFDAWKRKEDFYSQEFAGGEVERYYRRMSSILSYPDSTSYNPKEVFYTFFFPEGSVNVVRQHPLAEEGVNIMRRFARVFGLMYRRFLDLQKAEAQAREAQIETALERVRSRTMGMQHSDELREAAALLFQQVRALGGKVLSCGYNIWEEDETAVTSWMSSPQGDIQPPLRVPLTEDSFYKNFFKAKQRGETLYVEEVTGKKLEDERKYLATVPGFQDSLNASVKAGYPLPTYVIHHLTFFSKGFLLFITLEPCPELWDIFKRFAIVFEQTYTRFLDLKRAEAQAREAQIEAALERVRSKTMAMHNSEEVGDTVVAMFDELLKLGIRPFRCGIGIFHDEYQLEAWTARPDADGKTVLVIGRLDMSSHPLLSGAYNGWKNKESSFTYVLKGDAVAEYFAVVNNQRNYPVKYDLSSLPSLIIHHDFYFSEGTLYVFTLEPLSSESAQIFKRFASVFGQTYRRYLDLQRAEAQAREARIEAALEKVRGRAMAMHTSNDLSATARMVFAELRTLGIHPIRTGVTLLTNDSQSGVFYAGTSSRESEDLALIGSIDMTAHPCLQMQYESWLKKENYFPELNEEEQKSYHAALFSQPSVPVKSEELRRGRYGYYFPFDAGLFYAWTESSYSADEIGILSRFKAIIDLTFRRYLDLQKAEAQAREAQIEASLERVRSRTLAMQKSDELAETAAVLFKQLIALGIEPNRLYIAIVKDDDANVEFWITDEDGSKVSSGFTANLLTNRSWKKMFTGWRDGKKSLTIDMHGEELQEYFRHLRSLNVPFKGGLSHKRRVQSLAYFSRGFIGMASPDEQPVETTTLLERFAAVVNLTFTRFNDLKLAEAQAHQAHLDLIHLQTEKKRAEDALSELSATQAQLVQQEKLASLGQLTAGIAHEIKNPLNFVNNFSSLCVELVDEVMEKLTTAAPGLGTGEIPHLLGDIKANLSRIMEHGTRADGIVKSMLQHSRGGSSRMEPTDLNALIKEYVNLAFHGMRASKNPMNVDIELDFDKTVGFVSLKAEDFSRVILNLCQNAFDAMREKQDSGNSRQGSGSYLPKLTVRTRRENNRVAIRIEDNGPGIPDAIRDKVLQPFFTTKKGTQGTGLGLSITNDIVKAHGGEIRIEGNGNGGATFVIGLPNEMQK